jgi:ferredoxin-NADP reductase
MSFTALIASQCTGRACFAPCAAQYDKLILVASGVGLTPMLSLMDKYCGHKQLHLLWATRDKHMIKHFAPALRQCRSTVWSVSLCSAGAYQY